MRFGYWLAAAALSFGVAITALAPQAEAKTTVFKVVLSGAKETPPHKVPAKGYAKVVFDDKTHILSWRITYKGLSGPATLAHFHGPAAPGKAAPPIVTIDPHKLASPIVGSVTLTPVEEHELMAGLWYFNIHTAANPKGEIRGQLVAHQS